MIQVLERELKSLVKKSETPFKTAELYLREMGYEVIGIYLKRLYGLDPRS